ncbi:MAG: sigma-54-dependent Fis family transcriptional regulator [Rhodospirillaceae bacterium]|nr:sigma-54-dependent Fis family transcriptional regulator [Rhodospirillaceae bacterium]|tara:strand:- start:653 stop:2032 length:1380 start_codon:yes stop_codon:yes gene_type:complete
MKVLIVGRLEGHITEASKIAIARGAKVAHVNSISEAMNALRSGQGAEVAMVDVNLDVGDMVSQLENERINLPIVACGIGNDSNAAVDAIKGGAKEYVPLPPDPELIAAVLEAVSQESNAIVHADPAMKQVLAFADKIAPADASALITGQSGTGKELMARYIHVKSKRSTNNFVAVNCAAIPENLLESELFGHEKGAFTGAVARRIGKFEEANGGTLLLDEISEMHVRLQAKLLRAIQEREIDRVGGTQPIKVDVRIVATSNRNLEAEVKNGEFREDLFFRLNVIEIKLPSLRERPQDIPVLANFFAEKYAEANGVDRLPIGTQAMDLLRSHAWRGNVRELENTMHRAVLLAQGNEIGTEAIVLSGGGQDEVASVAATAAAAVRENGAEPELADGENPTKGLVGRTVAEVERDLIIDTLQHCLGNRTHAANILGISIRTLRNKLKQYNEEGVPVPLPGEG